MYIAGVIATSNIINGPSSSRHHNRFKSVLPVDNKIQFSKFVHVCMRLTYPQNEGEVAMKHYAGCPS